MKHQSDRHFESAEELEEVFARFLKRWRVDYKTAEKDFWTIYRMKGKQGIYKAIRSR